MVNPNIPDRGDLIWLEFDPRSGREQAGRRPALVVSPASYNERVGLALCCPVTTRIKGYPFEVAIPEGLPVSGVVLSDQVKSLDWRERKASFIAKLPDADTIDVLRRIGALLGDFRTR